MKLIYSIITMNDLSCVRGITLTDYFKLHDLEPFEDSEEMDCLVGELMTKPQDINNERQRIEEKSEGEENDDPGKNYEQSAYRNTQYSEFPKPSIHHTSTKNSRAENRKQKHVKLSSVELRASSIKMYKSDKMRIRQVSNSPYQRKLSKQKESFNTIYGTRSPKMLSSIQQHPLLLESKQYPIEMLQKYYRNAASLMAEENKSGLISRQVKKVRDLERSNEIKKGKLEGISNTMNAYTKKIREHQKAKHQL